MSEESSKKSVAFEGPVELAKVMDYLKALQQGLKRGAVYVQHGNEVVALEPESTVDFAVEARSKKDKQSLKLEIRWEKTPLAEDAVTDVFVISDSEPEILADVEA